MMSKIHNYISGFNVFLNNKNEKEFKAIWHPETYSRNISGPEGKSGENVFLEFSENPDLSFEVIDIEYFEESEFYIVGVYVFNNKNRDVSLFYNFLLLEKNNDNFLVRAFSESKEELEGLISDMSDRKQPVFYFEGEHNNTEIATEFSTEASVSKLFLALNAALDKKEEQSFANHWIGRAYYHNLCGEGGISGQELFTQAKNAAWHINPLLEYASQFDDPEALLLPISIWLSLMEMKKPGDDALMLLIKKADSYKIIGFGTDLSSMRLLYLKYKEGLQ